MFKSNLKTFLLLTAIWIGTYALIYATNILRLEIIPGTITISSDKSTNIIIDITYSTIEETIDINIATWTFAVRDLNGTTAYYTTIQATKLNQDGGTGTISTDNIEFKAGPIIKILWADNPNVQIGSALNWTFGNIGDPKTYFYNTGATGPAGEYSDYPTLKITIPANTPSGTYEGKLYYLLKKN